MKRFFVFLAFWMFGSLALASGVRIVIDPGDGGPDEPGFTSNGFVEKDTNLLLAKKIQSLVETEDKYEVVLTRSADYPLAPNDRRKIANQYENAIYVSVHSATYDKAPKVMIYIQKQATTSRQTSILTPIDLASSKAYSRSLKFSKTIEEEFPEHLAHETEISPFPLSSLTGIEPPAIMIECQCISQANPSKDDGSLDDVARIVSDGIQKFL